MRYGLSLLVCFAISVCANAQTVCNGSTRPNPAAFAKVVISAPVAVVRGNVASCCGSQGSSKVSQVGPIRQFFRNVFRR